MSYGTIGYEVEDGVATITLRRSEKLNAFTNGMMREVIEAPDRVDADDAVRAVIFTGRDAPIAPAPISARGPTASTPVWARMRPSTPTVRHSMTGRARATAAVC